MSNEKDKGAAPDIVLTDGALRAASWREEGEYGPFYNTKITRRYTNGDGEVRETTSLRERDLLPAAELTTEVHRAIRDRKREHARDHRQDLSRDEVREYEQNEPWHDENQTRDDVNRERFQETRRPGRDHSRSKARDRTAR